MQVAHRSHRPAWRRRLRACYLRHLRVSFPPPPLLCCYYAKAISAPARSAHLSKQDAPLELSQSSVNITHISRNEYVSLSRAHYVPATLIHMHRCIALLSLPRAHACASRCTSQQIRFRQQLRSALHQSDAPIFPDRKKGWSTPVSDAWRYSPKSMRRYSSNILQAQFHCW